MTAIYDRDPGDENDAREPEPSPSTGMCVECKENEALPNQDICGGCLLDFEIAFGEDELP